MQNDRFYPPLDEKVIKRLILIHEADLSYFDDPFCPYSTEIKLLFKGKTKAADFDVQDYVSEDSDDILKRIAQLSGKLQQYWKDMNNSSEPSSPADKNTYFRLEAMLLEKIIDFKKEVTRIKDYEKFTFAVLEVLDKELNPDQRTAVMERLKSLTGAPLTETI